MDQQQILAVWEAARPYLPLVLFGLITLVILRSNFAKRLYATVTEIFFTNWRLAILGSAGLVLSAASGWTTWDGMTNFTGEPVLSGMITFGIQAVLLIISWLIGETFATGMSHSAGSNASAREKTTQAISGGVLGLIVMLALFIWWLPAPAGDPAAVGTSVTGSAFQKIADNFAIIAAGLGIAALMALYAASDIVRPYLQGSRVILRNAMLWVMLIACMSTAVFFSFDSRFNAVFPASERVRAAEFRAQSQTGGLIADISQVIAERSSTEAEALFSNDKWQTYERQLIDIGRVAADSNGAIERYINKQIEDRARAVKEQQERMASAQSGQAGLASRKISLTEEKARLVTDRPGLAAEYAEKKGDLDAKAREVDAKRVDALAEGKGVEGTGKEGRGPVYRERMAELGKMQDAYKIAEERTKDAQKRLGTVETRLAQIDRELATLDGDLAKLKGEADTAGQRIKLATEATFGDTGPKLDPSRLVPAFDRARAEFREKPSSEGLAKIQAYCGDVYGALSATPDTKEKLGGLDCDPKPAADAAGGLFAVQAGAKAFSENCVGGEKLTANKTVDGLFGFTRKCLADSGLPSADTDKLRTKINSAELNRDDKAHRFVVTWNAFQDGNRLAYLALAISIGIEALIFMSGLFGANALRSPLSDVPSHKARSGHQLEATMNAALGTTPHETAWMTLNTLKPITNTDGFSAIADLSGLDKSSADRVRMVLTAGADIGAVQLRHGGHLGRMEAYAVRSELREYLSSVVERYSKSDSTLADRAKLNQAIRDAVAPHARDNADIVLGYLEPIGEIEGFTSMLSLSAIANPYDASTVRRVITAAVSFGSATPDKKEDDRFFLKPEVFGILSRLRANEPASAVFSDERSGISTIRTALAPHPREHADIVLNSAEPIRNQSGFTSALSLLRSEDAYEERVLRRTMNAGAAVGHVAPDPTVNDRFLLKSTMYEVLLRIRASEPASANFDADRVRFLRAHGHPTLELGRAASREGGSLSDDRSRIANDADRGSNQTAIGGPQKSLTARPALTHEERVALQHDFHQELLDAIGLTPDRVDARLKNNDVRDAAIAAWRKLYEYGNKNPILGDLLRRYQQTQEEALSQRYTLLRREIDGDERKIDELDAIDKRVQDQLPAFMLFPENGLTKFLIDELEYAAQHDDGEAPGEDALRDMLRAVHTELGRANLASSNSWREIGRMLTS